MKMKKTLFSKNLRKGDFTITTQSIFVLFLSLFIILLIILFFKNSEGLSSEKERFDEYSYINDFYVRLLSSDCFSAAKNSGSGILLDASKLDALQKMDKEPGCLEHQKFFYYITIADRERKWEIGRKSSYEKLDRQITITSPAGVYYDEFTIVPGDVSLTAYFNDLSFLLYKINEGCKDKKGAVIRITLQSDVSYSSENGNFQTGTQVLKPDFDCKVENFHLPGKNQLVFLDYQKGMMKVRS